MAEHNYEKDLMFAADLAVSAGDIVDKYWHEDVVMDTKADGTPVSVVDTEINDMVLLRTEAEYPEHRIISEEGCGGVEGSDRAWVVDPFDGSQTFGWRTRAGTFSGALVEEGVAKVAVVYEFGEQVMHCAVKGGGAFRKYIGQPNARLKPLIVSGTQNWRHTKGTVNANKAFQHHNPYLLTTELMSNGEGSKLLDYGGFCFNSMLVAQGHWGFAIAGFQTEYDAAAVSLIVPEAGGKVTDLEGNEQRYDRAINGALVTNGRIHDGLLEILAGVTR